MACPFFWPEDRFDEQSWRKPPRLPLGDPYRGACHAVAGQSFRPDETTLRELCNCGYARARCPRFPLDWAADAVRFSVIADRGDRLEIRYVVEKNYSPAEHGPLEYSVAAQAFAGAHTSELLTRQARVFVESYLRRRVTG